MPFGNPVVGFDGVLIREWIRSSNYVAGSTGWIIRQDGTFELAGGTFRGDIEIVDPDGSYILIDTTGGRAGIALRPPDDGTQQWNPARVYGSLSDFGGGGPGNLSPSVTILGPSELAHPPVTAPIPTIEVMGPSAFLDDSIIMLDARGVLINNNIADFTDPYADVIARSLDFTIYASANINGDFAVIKGIGEKQFLPKTANQTVNNSAVLVNDNDLLAGLDVANGVYFFRAYVVISSTTNTPDIKFAWTVPAGATLNWVPNGLDPSVAAGTPQGIIRRPNETVSGGARTIATVGTGANATVALLEGWVQLGATTGTLQLQWAQNTATAENTTVTSGSYLIVERVA